MQGILLDRESRPRNLLQQEFRWPAVSLVECPPEYDSEQQVECEAERRALSQGPDPKQSLCRCEFFESIHALSWNRQQYLQTYFLFVQGECGTRIIHSTNEEQCIARYD